MSGEIRLYQTMLIAASLVVALLASTSASTAAVNRAALPVVIDVSAASNVPSYVVQIAQAEADAIFRAAGITFLWRDGRPSPVSIRVVIANEQGPARDVGTPLGWLMFEDGAPVPTLHLSYANAERYMLDSREVVGVITTKTRAERETLLGRVLGRALAHELAHFLLATKEHTARGLLKGAPTAQEFFSTDRSAFKIDADERLRLAARLSRPSDLARRLP